MKNVVLFFICLPVLGFSQKRNKNDVPTTSLDSIVYDLNQKTLAPSGISLPFKSIEILDARFDTSKLGYELHRQYDIISYKDFKKIKLDGGVQRQLEFFYNDYYSLSLKDSMNKLLIVLKTLWIDNAPSDFLLNRNINERETESESYQNIHLKWEYYIKKEDKYYPLKRVDTVYQLTEGILASRDHKFRKNDLSFFTFALKSQLEQINLSNISKYYENKQGYTFYSIDSFNRKRFLSPVITGMNIKKGVFKNFEEFKNNMPGVELYQLKKRDKGKYWIDLKTSDIIKNIFLISDSIGLHTGAEKRISVLRVGNTFEFFEAGFMPVPHSLVGNLLRLVPDVAYGYAGQLRFSPGIGSDSQGVLIPRQINMETGEVY